VKTAYFIIATHNYIKFVQPLVTSIRNYYLKEHQTDIFIFTDKVNNNFGKDTYIIPTVHKPFPYPTLMRYHIILDHKKRYEGKYEYYHYSDADMLILKEIDEIIISDITATEHPGFYCKPRETFSYEKRPESSAYISKEQGKKYYAGGFNGGMKYLKMAEEIKNLIDIDSKKCIIAEWHDESYLNKYLLTQEPTKILTPQYCFPEHDGYTYPNLVSNNMIHDIKVLALKKDYRIRN
jgi:histo-blood group ABO system transferase